MKIYSAKKMPSQGFGLWDENGTLLGEIVYPKWYSVTPEIKLNNNVYKVERKSVWKLDIEVSENNKALLIFTMNWKGEIEVDDLLNLKKYTLCKEKWYGNTYQLKNSYQEQLLILEPEVNFKSFMFGYKIKALKEEGSSLLEILSMVYALHYFTVMNDVSATTLV